MYLAHVFPLVSCFIHANFYYMYSLRKKKIRVLLCARRNAMDKKDKALHGVYVAGQ